MEISAIIATIEETAKLDLQAPWDRSGMQVASPRSRAGTLGIFLDPVLSVVDRALDAGAEFLLCHHPLSLKPELPGSLDAYYKVLRRLMRADTGLYAAHTSLDVNLSGPAGWLGRELGLEGCVPLEKLNVSDGNFGYGEIGSLPAPMQFGTVVNRIMQLGHIEYANLCGPIPEEMCRRIAYCGGSGGSMWRLAKAAGADLYVTGDIKYHTALETALPVLDVGHHCLEEEMMRRFALLLTEKLPEVNVLFFPSASPFRRAYR